MIVHVLLADGVHGRAEFVARLGFHLCFDVGQKHEHELWNADGDAVRGLLCCIRLQELYVDADFYCTK